MGIIQFIKSVCVQSATVWQKSVADGFGGYAYTKREISCRWDGVNEQVSDKKGVLFNSNAKVMVPMADMNQIEVGDFIGLGSFTSLVPAELDEVYMIRRIDKSPLFKSDNSFVYTIFLGGVV